MRNFFSIIKKKILKLEEDKFMKLNFSINDIVKLLENIETENELRSILFDVMSGKIPIKLFIEALTKANLDPKIEKMLDETDIEENDHLKRRN